MNESAPELPNQDISSYESKVVKGYDQLGQEGLGIEKWGTTMVGSRRFNAYTDTGFIRNTFSEPIQRMFGGKDNIVIADLGGDNGYLLNQVTTDLREDNPQCNIQGMVTDIDSIGKARQAFEREKKEGHRENIEYVVGDITKLPFATESLDVVISRMALQYLDEKQQKEFFDEISRVLRKEGLGIIQSVAAETNDKGFNEVMSQVTQAISGSSNFKRYFPHFGTFTRHTDFSQEFNLSLLFGSTNLIFPLSAQAWADRFHIDVKILEDIFEKEQKKYPELFSVIDGQLCIRSRLLDLRFKKV